VVRDPLVYAPLAVSDPTPSRSLHGADVLADPLVRELLHARLVGVLATAEAGGRIHAVPMWLAVDGDTLVLATGSRSRKVRNLRREPVATLVLHDSRPGFEICGASIRGRIELVAGDEARPLIELVHRRYVVAEAKTFSAVAEFLASDDVALRLRPDEAFTWDERGSEAARVLHEAGGALPLLPTDSRYFGSGSSL
jgi:PPOX class probable F420-dependent enzyme